MNRVQLMNFTNIPFGIEFNNNVVERRFIADGMNVFERNVKRAGDCLLAISGLIVFSPLFAVCYFLVKREDRTQYSFMQYKHLDDVLSTLCNSHASFVLLYRSHKVSPSLYY